MRRNDFEFFDAGKTNDKTKKAEKKQKEEFLTKKKYFLYSIYLCWPYTVILRGLE